MTVTRPDTPAGSLHDTQTDGRTLNIAEQLTAMAVRYPDKRAVVWTVGRDASGRARYAHVTFEQLDRETDRYAHGLETVGITRGTRTRRGDGTIGSPVEMSQEI